MVLAGPLGAGPILDRPGNNPSDVVVEQGPWATPESFNTNTAVVTGTLNGRLSIFSIYSRGDTLREPFANSAIWGWHTMSDSFTVSLPDAATAVMKLKWPNENTWMVLPTTREPVPPWTKGDSLGLVAEPGVAWRAMYYECVLTMWGYAAGNSPPTYVGHLEFRSTHIDSSGLPVVMNGVWRTHP